MKELEEKNNILHGNQRILHPHPRPDPSENLEPDDLGRGRGEVGGVQKPGADGEEHGRAN